MSWGEEQKKEIETIRERKITVKLSDADCDRLARKCGKHGLTIGELIENFVVWWAILPRLSVIMTWC